MQDDHTGDAIEIIQEHYLIEVSKALGVLGDSHECKEGSEEVYDAEGEPHLEDCPEAIVNAYQACRSIEELRGEAGGINILSPKI